MREGSLTMLTQRKLSNVLGRALGIAGLLATLAKCTASKIRRTRRYGTEPTNHRHGRLLRPRRQRPCRRGAAEQRYELPPLHSITSSARASSDGGTVMPTNLAA